MNADAVIDGVSTSFRFKPSIAQSVGVNETFESGRESLAAVWAFDVAAALSGNRAPYASTSTVMRSPIGIGETTKGLYAALIGAVTAVLSRDATGIRNILPEPQVGALLVPSIADTYWHQEVAAFIAENPRIISILQPERVLPLLPGFSHRSPDTVTTQEMVSKLKAKGMPISALADVLDVERKTVYSWLDQGIEPNAANYERLGVVYELLSTEADGSLRFFHRFWDRKLSIGSSLKEALMATEIDASFVMMALDALRPTVERSMRADIDRKIASTEKSASSTLTMDLIVGHWS